MITIVVHDCETAEPLRVEPDLVAHILRTKPRISAGSIPGMRTLVFAMSHEEWAGDFPAARPPAV
ncbi:MAG: hypothetical protein ING29_08795 [Azospirillum sp.]|nr:hypothetical protein [Azospirillum sp.]MCZ8125246.1 hypothetical protein [Magnetospirillum sp.]